MLSSSYMTPLTRINTSRQPHYKQKVGRGIIDTARNIQRLGWPVGLVDQAVFLVGTVDVVLEL
jgi:hypothetical protein